MHKRFRNSVSRWSAIGFILPVLAFAPTAAAQEEILDECRRAPSAEARIACLEDALRRQSAASSAQTPATAPAAAPAPAPVREAGERQSTLGRMGSAISSINPFSGSEDREGAGQVSSQDAAADRFGAGQVAARTASRTPASAPSERMAARVADVTTVPYQRLEVTLDNGQVWRQITGDRQRLNERHVTGNTVDIWETRLGGYQMRLNEIARTIRVERIR